MRRATALLRAILETAPAPICAKDADGRIVVANGPVIDLIGKPCSEVKERANREFLDDPARFRSVMSSKTRTRLIRPRSSSSQGNVVESKTLCGSPSSPRSSQELPLGRPS
jgi:PAS domain S-box-containing protein